MTPIEEMLRATLADTPTATPANDPLALLDSRVRRARRRIAVGAAGVAAAVAAAVVVPLATIGGGHDASVQIGQTPTPSPSATASTPQGSQADVWLQGGARGVATNDARGHSFVVIDHGNGATRRLLELGPGGSELQHWTVPESALFVAHREGSVWVWGGGDGAFPTPIVTAVDVRSGITASIELPRYGAVNDLAITEGGDAWAVTTDHVLHLTVASGKPEVIEDTPVPGASRIVTDSGGSLWVRANAGLVRLEPNGAPYGVYKEGPYTLPWADGLLLAIGAETDQPRLWVQTGPRQVGLFLPLTGDDLGGTPGDVVRRLDLPGRAGALTEDGIGGVFVALDGGGVVFYDFATASADVAGGVVTYNGPPTAKLPRDVEVETMAPALDGGVVIQTFGGVLLHWKPPPS